MKYLCIKNTQTDNDDLPYDLTHILTIGEWYEVSYLVDSLESDGSIDPHYAIFTNGGYNIVSKKLLDLLFRSKTELRLERLDEILMH